MAMGIAISWALGGGVIWALGCVAAAGLVSPIIIEGHRRHGHFQTRHALRWYSLALIPVLFTLGTYIAGLFIPTASRMLIDGQQFLVLNESQSMLPTTMLPTQSWLALLYFVAVYMSGIGLCFVALTITLLRRILLVLCINAAAIAIVGFAQFYSGADHVFWFLTTSNTFFGPFTHSEHYASFALIWSIVLFGLIMHLRRQNTIERFAERWGLLIFAAWAILAFSCFLTGTELHRSLLLVGIGWCLFSEGGFTRTAGHKGKGITAMAIGFALISGGLFYLVLRWIQFDNITGLPWAQQSLLWQDAWQRFMERPLFGWGIGSYKAITALQGEVSLPGSPILTPHSDLLHLLVEQGILGLLVWSAPILYLAYRFTCEKSKRLMSAHLWVATIMLLILATVSFPLQNPACLFSFWLILGTAYAWSKVQSSVPGVVPKAHVVFDESEMSRVQKLDRPRGRTQSRIERKHF